MPKTYNRFEDLPVWQEAIRLVGAVYDMTESKEWKGSYRLRDQIERGNFKTSSRAQYLRWGTAPNPQNTESIPAVGHRTPP